MWELDEEDGRRSSNQANLAGWFPARTFDQQDSKVSSLTLKTKPGTQQKRWRPASARVGGQVSPSHVTLWPHWRVCLDLLTF